MPKGEYVSSRDENKFRGTCRVQIVRSSADWSLGIPREVSIIALVNSIVNLFGFYISIRSTMLTWSVY